MKSTKELVVGKLYCVDRPNETAYQETNSILAKNLKLGFFIDTNESKTKNMSNNQRFFLFLGLKEGQFRFFTSGYEILLNPGAILKLKEAVAETKD